jgi:hypothetical protein
VSDDREYTPEEARAVRALQRLAKTWPRTLTLFSNSGTLWVMHTTDAIEITPADFIECVQGIPNDGGDADWQGD